LSALPPRYRKLLWTFAILAAACPESLYAAGPEGTSPENSCLAITDPSWLPGEKFAWQQVCKGVNADFGSRSGSEKSLRIGFLRQILSDPQYKKFTKRILISGAKINSIDISKSEIVDAEVDELELVDCAIDYLQLTDPKIRLLTLKHGTVDTFAVNSGRLSGVTLSPKTANFVTFEHVNIDSSLNVYGIEYGPDYTGVDTNISHLSLNDVRGGEFAIAFGPRINSLEVQGCILDAYFHVDGKIDNIEIMDCRIDGTLELSDVDATAGLSQLIISNTNAERIRLPTRIPSHIQLSSLRFSSWQTDLPDTIAYLTKNQYDADLFERIVQSFREEGNYSAVQTIQYLRGNAD
jgi:hypothetical protein